MKMYQVTRQLSLFSFLLLLVSNCLAQDDSLRIMKKRYDFVQRKSITKSYPITSVDQIELNNGAGKIEIHAWSKKEIKVDVELITSAKTDEWAKTVLNDIDIETWKRNGRVLFKTLFVNDLDKKEGKPKGKQRIDKYLGKDTRQILEVNYTVYMPVTNPLKISNMFGAIVIPDYKGAIDLFSSGGIVLASKLEKVKAIKLLSGKATFETLKDCAIELEESTVVFKKLSGNIKLKATFCKKVEINMSNDLKKIDILESYSNINLKPTADFSATYSIATNYCDFQDKIKFDWYSRGGDNRRVYNCKTGKGLAFVKVEANFGKIIIGDASAEDLTLLNIER